MESNSEIRKAIKRGSLRASFFVDLGDLMGCRAVPCRNNPRRTKRSFVRWVYFAPLIFKKNYGDQLVFTTTKIGQNAYIFESSERKVIQNGKTIFETK